MGIKAYMLSVMNDERSGPIESVLRIALSFASLFYKAAIRSIDAAYTSGRRRVFKVPVPVVSIGNLTLGGTGKTPLTVFVAEHYSAAGHKPAILTRGYGKDEDRMLREDLVDIPVYSGRDRRISALTAASEGCDVIIMDDGFQHRTLERDLDIVLMTPETLAGKDKLFPRGTMREGYEALSRADAVIVTKADRMTEERKAAAALEAAKIVPGRPVAFAEHKPVFLTDITGTTYPLENISGMKTLLVSGIADPGYFALSSRKLGALIVGRMEFPDHHAYSGRDAERIEKEAALREADVILTTAKDFIKLRRLDLSAFEEKIFVLRVRAEISEGKETLIARLDSVLSGKRPE
ncbi:MAG: tetraacyldisaccharide 4'-kinase [Candidatus Omnitrophica bacterium]|nr:tetraacyldisaccharide 4'-kinase [Candidatus Omnitrophota bacterium]